MGVLAVFDAEGNWAQTHVCDSLIQQNLTGIGASWGRWNVQAPWPAGGGLTALLHSRREEFRQLQQRFGVASATRIRLAADARDDVESAEAPRPQLRDSLAVYWVLEGIQVIYLQNGTGHVGVLCEAGEWLSIPAGVTHRRDAGETPHLDLLVLTDGDVPSSEARDVDAKDGLAALPSFDTFVETMLELTGNEAD